MFGFALLIELINLSLVSSDDIVGASLVVGDIKSDTLLERIDTEHSYHIEDQEKWGHDSHSPIIAFGENT